MIEDKRIRTLEELKVAAKDGLDCFILLNGGISSSKHIWYDPDDDHFEVIHMIDGSEEWISSADIMDHAKSNIGLAMSKGSLIKD